MVIKGKFKNNSKIGDFPNCEFSLENGKLYNLKVDLPAIHAFSYPPKNKSKFEFEKLPSQKGLVPFKSNYIIEYVGELKVNHTIYLKLNLINTFRVKWQLKKSLIF